MKLCSGWVEKMPTASVPQTPHTKCTDVAPTGSSSFSLSRSTTALTASVPASSPTRIALDGMMTSAPALMATKPARIPLSISDNSGFRLMKLYANMAPAPPAAPAKQVFTRTNEVRAGSADSTEPPLNPNQPSHKTSTPMVTKGMLDPGMGFNSPRLPYFPRRGPKSHTPTSAAQPPTECTRVDPEKSWKPRSAMNPWPHVHELAMGNTNATNGSENKMNALSLMRSATAPETMVAQVAANMARNKNPVQYV